MEEKNKKYIACIGSVYLETNYLGLVTDNTGNLKVGKEYRASKWEVRLGGSVVNFAVQGKKLGLKIALIGKVGSDEAGSKLLNLLNKEGISTQLIKVAKDSHIQTSVDTGLIFENGNNIQIVGGNANQDLSLNDIDINNSLFDSLTTVYLGGFTKQTKLYPDYPALLQSLKAKGVRIFLDHGRIPVDITTDQLHYLTRSLAYVEGYFPNLEELREVTKENDLDKALTAILQMGPKFIAVKMDKSGCRVKSKEEDILVSGHKVKAISTVGAGDVFNAGFISQYLVGQSLKNAAVFANATAALRVSKNRNPELSEVEALLNDQHK